MNMSVMARQVFSVLLLAALAASAPVTSRRSTAALSYLLSWRTGRYLEVAASGEISATGNFGDEVALFDVTFLDETTVLRAESAAFPNNYMVFTANDESVRAEVPTGGNDLFEIVELGPDWIALRVPNYSVGSGFNSEEGDLMANTSECFIGFSGDTGAPLCYDSTEHVETRLHVFTHTM